MVESDGRLRANTLALATASYVRTDDGASCDGGRDNADIALTYEQKHDVNYNNNNNNNNNIPVDETMPTSF